MNRADEADFEAFVVASGRRLLRTAYLMVGDVGEAEDLVQTTLERTAQRWTRLDGAPEAYARTVLAHLATDRWRGLRRRPVEVRDTLPELAAADAFDGVLVRQALISALYGLPRRQRAVLVLRFFEDLTEAETASALGISVGTVKSTTSRGLDRIRAEAKLRDLNVHADLTKEATNERH